MDILTLLLLFINEFIFFPSICFLVPLWCKTMVVSWITRTLSTQIAQSTIYYKRYFQWGSEKWVFLISTHILWEELESLRSSPSCSCDVKCNCDLMKNIKKHKKSEYVICKRLIQLFKPAKSKRNALEAELWVLYTCSGLHQFLLFSV